MKTPDPAGRERRTKRRPTIAELCELTGLVYCDADCPCGENSRLFFTDVTTPAKWRDANGWAREDVERKLNRETKGA